MSVWISVPIVTHRPGPKHSIVDGFSGLGSDRLPCVFGVEDAVVVMPGTPMRFDDDAAAAYLIKRHGGRYLDYVDCSKPDMIAKKG